MITVDANLLIYAYHSAAPGHRVARQWVEASFSGNEPVRLAWTTIHAFLRIVTHPRIFQRPFAMEEAHSFVSEWFEQPAVGILEPGERYWAIFSEAIESGQVRGNLVMDAHLAALSIEHGAVLATTDRDFTRFDKLQTVNPLRQ